MSVGKKFAHKAEASKAAAGAPFGGWAATRLPPGPLTRSTWLTAIAGTAVLLLAYLLVTGRAGGRMALR